jgi:DNA-binding response OmpR family regulator
MIDALGKFANVLDAAMNLIICETSGDWRALLQQRLTRDVALIEARSLMEISDRVEASPCALIALEWTASHAESLLAEIARIDRKHPRAKVIMLSHRDPSCDEAACREAGAVHVITSRRRIGEVVGIVQHLLHCSDWAEADNDEQDPETAIIARLPWRQ